MTNMVGMAESGREHRVCGSGHGSGHRAGAGRYSRRRQGSGLRPLFFGAIGFLLLLLASCNIDRLDTACCYNVQLTFRYFYDPATERYDLVGNQTHLLFDGDLLVGKLKVNGSVGGEGLLAPDAATPSLRQLTCTLPKGEYTLLSWGNYNEGISIFSDRETGKEGYDNLVVGQTLRSAVDLRMVKASPSNHGTLTSCERLYYGYCDFRFDGTNRVRHTVDMLNAHMQLFVTVVWKDPARDVIAKGAVMQNISMRLGQIPTGYRAYNLSNPSTGGPLILGITANEPLYGPRRVEEYVPAYNNDQGTVSTTMSQLETAKTWSNVTSYRLQDNDHPILSLWGSDGTTRLMKDVDLGRFFATIGWARTYNLRQYYEILVTVDGDTVTVEPIDNIGWIDGGAIGGLP